MEEQGKQIRLTSAEISQLWSQYMTDSGSICSLSYFLEKAEDAEIKPVIVHALNLSKSHIQTLTAILTEEKIKVPHGFKVEDDVDLTAPRLYSDTYVLHYIQQMSRIGLTTYSTSVSASVRSDITEFYIKCMSEVMELFKISKEVLLSKGLFIRSPYITDMEEVEYVKKQGFIWDIFGEKRPLTVNEIACLFANVQRNAFGSATLGGFAQVTQSKDVQKFFVRGIEIAKKHVKLFGNKLEDSNLPVPSTWDSDITNSTKYTFSDKLMMFTTSALISLSIGYYGTGLSLSPRGDLGAMYNRLSAELQLYAEDGANIMIKSNWLEQPPLAPDRYGLTNKNSEK